MARIVVTLDGHSDKGGTPLVCHNERLADPLDPISKEIAKISGLRKKTEANHLEIARLEFAGGLYHDEDLGPYIPTWNIIRSIQEAGKQQKLGAAVLRALVPGAEKAAIQYDGPRDIGAMWEDGRFVLRKGVGISGRRVMRTRPVFVDWVVEADLELDIAVLNPDKIDQLALAAGKYEGLGDNRPQYGRFRGSAELANVALAAAIKKNGRAKVTA